MFIVYDLLFLIFALVYFPFAIIRGKWHSGFWFRMGRIPREIIQELDSHENIWVHAVSVGEVLAVVDLIKKLKDKYPHRNIVCSTVTKTGYAIANETLEGLATVIFAPLDFSWVARKFVSIIDPKIYIAAETEIWPNLYSYLNEEGVPIIQVNGRISDKSYKGYQKLKFLTKKVLACVDRFCMQSQLDAKRIADLGAEKSKILIIGNLKFDNLPRSTILTKSDLGFKEEDDLLIAGSTHPGEEEILISIFKALRLEFSSLRLVICPRHIERAEEVVRIVGSNEEEPTRFSEIKHVQHRDDSIVVVDSIGNLRDLYSIAKFVFIGKTLTVGGGQNMIEPAFFGKPTFVGPSTHNFKDVVRTFLQEDALIQVPNEDQLLLQMKELLNDSERMDAVGKRAQRIVERYQGATTKTVEVIAEVLATKRNI